MKLNVLVLDIETAPLLAHIWELGEQRVTLNQIAKDWHVMAWAAKWLGDPPSKVLYQDQRGHIKHVENDREILLPLWKLLDKADVVITQNGMSFDGPKLNARFIMHGMKPPSPYRHLDTYRIVKAVAKFTSNKLEYLTNKLCTKYKKLSHGKYPGLSLWLECLKGNKSAWDEMKHYNIHDVLATEEFYTKVRAWAPESMAKAFYVPNVTLECGTCGEAGKMQRQGVRVENKARYQRYQCRNCGTWSKGEKLKDQKEAA